MISESQVQLFDDKGATGNGDEVVWQGGRGVCLVEGTFGETTFSLQFKSPNGTWIALGSDAELTAAGMFGFELPVGRIRGVLTSGTPSGIYAYAYGSRVA